MNFDKLDRLVTEIVNGYPDFYEEFREVDEKNRGLEIGLLYLIDVRFTLMNLMRSIHSRYQDMIPELTKLSKILEVGLPATRSVHDEARLITNKIEDFNSFHKNRDILNGLPGDELDDYYRDIKLKTGQFRTDVLRLCTMVRSLIKPVKSNIGN